MKTKIKLVATFITAIVSSTLPFYASADKLESIGTSISNVASEIGEVASDTAITGKVKTLLALEADIPMTISVTTINNVVHLSGTVDTRLQANKIIEIAQSVDKVSDINDSKLKVESSSSFFNDATITAKAKGKILQLSNSNHIRKGYNLNVETTNGDVHIFGTVTKKSDIDIIKKEISGITDVKSVSVNVQIKKR